MKSWQPVATEDTVAVPRFPLVQLVTVLGAPARSVHAGPLGTCQGNKVERPGQRHSGCCCQAAVSLGNMQRSSC